MKNQTCVVVVSVVLAVFGICGAEEPAVIEKSKPATADQLKENYAVESGKFHAMQEELQRISGRVDVSADGLQKAAARLDDQLEALLFEEAGSKARIQALSESIAELTKKAEDQATHDEAVEELKKVVAARQKAFERILAVQKAAAASVDEVERANAELSEAKIRLLDRQRHLGTAAGGDALTAWNRDLINLAVAAHEQQAQEKVLLDRRERIRNALGELLEFQLQEEKMKAARAKLLGVTYQFKAEER